MKVIENERSILQLQKWALPVSFCNAHDLPLPTMYPKYLAKNHDWFFFILCLDIFRYPYEQVLDSYTFKLLMFSLLFCKFYPFYDLCVSSFFYY